MQIRSHGAIGENACPFNFFYWDFLARHRDKLQSIRRMSFILANLDKMPPFELATIRQKAADWHLGSQLSVVSTQQSAVNSQQSTVISYLLFAICYQCPMPHAPCPMPHAHALCNSYFFPDFSLNIPQRFHRQV